MTTKEYRLNLWKEFMEHTDYINNRDKEIMEKIVGIYVDNTGFLFQVYEAFIENDRFMEDEQNGVRYEREDEEYILSYEGKECIFNKKNFKKVLAAMLDLLEDTIPLGSVVDLRKDAYAGIADLQDVEHIRMVVTYRFLGTEEESYYFPYAGVVYPTGMLGRKEVLYFTRPLVERIVKEGYRDEQEDAYVYLMKKELVVEKRKNSYGYADKEEIEAFNKKVKKGVEAGGK